MPQIIVTRRTSPEGQVENLVRHQLQTEKAQKSPLRQTELEYSSFKSIHFIQSRVWHQKKKKEKEKKAQ